MSSAFQDFIPEGEDNQGKRIFQDFIPAEEVKIDAPAKPKAKVTLTEEDKRAIAEMEAETIAQNGGVSIPTEDAPNPEPEVKAVEPKKAVKRSHRRKTKK